MIPSQTAYLRKKNEELLNILEENAKHLNRKVEICSELLRGRQHYREEDFTEHRFKSPEMSPTTKFNRSASVRQPVKILHNTSPVRLSARQIRSTSAERLHSPRREHTTCVPNQPISHESSGDSRWSKLQQDLASYAHMHGYTLSHALSKCYCTKKDGSESATCFTGSSRTMAEPFSRKARIPPRLTEKRYKANSPKRRPCTVKWAVTNKYEVPGHLPEDSYHIHLPTEDCDQQNNQKQSASLCGSTYARGDAPLRTRCATSEELNSETYSDFFAKVKNFRKSNWDDCHAPESGKNDKSHCNCNRVYMIGNRMFLEPLTSSVSNKECCCQEQGEEPKPPPRDTEVTLPKVPSDEHEKEKKSREENIVRSRRTEHSAGTYNINGPCFLTGHKTNHDNRIRAFVQQNPPDSFALRYQKGVDPRKL